MTERHQIWTTFTSEQNARLDRFAEREGRTRANAVRRLLLLALEMVEEQEEIQEPIYVNNAGRPPA